MLYVKCQRLFGVFFIDLQMLVSTTYTVDGSVREPCTHKYFTKCLTVNLWNLLIYILGMNSSHSTSATSSSDSVEMQNQISDETPIIKSNRPDLIPITPPTIEPKLSNLNYYDEQNILPINESQMIDSNGSSEHNDQNYPLLGGKETNIW